MNEIKEKTTFKEQLLAHFMQRLPSLYGDATLRNESARFFSENGFPTRRWEDYKYIAPDTLFKKEFGFRTELMRGISMSDVEKLTIVKDAHVLVIVNGIFVPELSSKAELPAGITVSSIAGAVATDKRAQQHYGKYAHADKDPFAALNTALNEGGIFIHAAKNAVAEKPFHLLHITDNETEAFFQPRNLVVVEENAQATIIESFETIGPVRSFNNALVEIAIAPGGKLDHYRIQEGGESGQLLSTVQADVAGNALYNTYTFILGGTWVRNNLEVVMSGRNGEAHLYGLYLLNGTQVADNHTVVDHKVPDCMSNELYKGVVSGKATAVFNGKIFVRPDAQKTNAFQTNRNILLSDDATVNTKPQLEIYADDVKCSHGTSTGRIDEESMFYLRSRGIGKEDAHALLIRAFAEEVVNHVKIEALREYIDKRIDDLLK
jgi:Fe-S cluster assembly protein SufD